MTNVLRMTPEFLGDSLTRLIQSSPPSWMKGVVLQQHISRPDVHVPTSENHHGLWQLRSASVAAERLKTRSFIPYAKVRGDVTTVPAGALANIRLHTSAKLLYIAFDCDYISGIVTEMDRPANVQPRLFVGTRDPALLSLLQLLHDEMENGFASGAVYSESLAHALAIRLLHLDCPAQSSGSKSAFPLPQRVLARVQDMIEGNLHQNLSLQELARKSGYSRTHFIRMFRAATGLTPHQFLLSRRLDRATMLLRHRENPLAAVAAQCGFASQSHMTDVFRQRFGLTPGEFRRNS